MRARCGMKTLGSPGVEWSSHGRRSTPMGRDTDSHRGANAENNFRVVGHGGLHMASTEGELGRAGHLPGDAVRRRQGDEVEASRRGSHFSHLLTPKGWGENENEREVRISEKAVRIG